LATTRPLGVLKW